MLWIYQAQSNDVRWLQERDIHIWDEWEISEEGLWKATQNVPVNGKYVKPSSNQFTMNMINTKATLPEIIFKLC